MVEGATRVGTPLAAMLAASGVGRVTRARPGTHRRRRRRRRRPERRRRGPPAVPGRRGRGPPGEPADRPAAAGRPTPLPTWSCWPGRGRPPTRWPPGIHRSGVPHLVATVRGETGVVGPLVVPGVDQLPALRRPAPPRRRPALAPAGRPADRRRAPAERRDDHLPADRRDGRAAGARLPGRLGRPGVLEATVELRPPQLTPRVRRWPAAPAALRPAEPLRRRRATLAGDPATAPVGAEGPGREQWAADRARELTETTRRRRTGRCAGEEDA